MVGAGVAARPHWPQPLNSSSLPQPFPAQHALLLQVFQLFLFTNLHIQFLEEKCYSRFRKKKPSTDLLEADYILTATSWAVAA